MSSVSGIGLSPALSEAFQSALEGNTVRFLKIAIENESLVPGASIEVDGTTLEDDLPKLQDLLEDDVPAYILARLDGQNAGWLAITYVPDSASVRAKMLYASTRSSLTKSIGSSHFTDTLFATSKTDLTPEAYIAHKAHLAAPQPLSAREREIADARAAERQMGVTYEGSRARRSYVGTGVGLNWSEEAKRAVQDLKGGQGDALVLLSIDAASETLILSSTTKCIVGELAGRLPSSEPSFAFFDWSRKPTPGPSGRSVVFIYTCPSSSPIKNRMLFSSGASAVHLEAKSLLAGSPSTSLAARKVETSDPTELTEAYLISELGLDKAAQESTETAASAKVGGEARGFARPKGPGRKR
ncbi:hypothetical protein M0805_001760 [Coniferiporia weirii]|nr:hypothetical protein M0805_001760 [Coniferiporia weirii]